MEPIPISDLLEKAGGAARLAELLGCDRTTPYSWKRIPAHHAAQVARIIGVHPCQVRPDVFPSPQEAAA